MAEKRKLDDTDLDIVGLLAADSRRSYRDIGEQVDLSPTAVSDRIDRLVDQDIIRRFTVDLDRSKIHGRTPILLECVSTPDQIQSTYEVIKSLEGIEHTFRTIDGRIVAHGSAPASNIGGWIREKLPMDQITELDIDLLDRFDWQFDIEHTAFQLSCVVCGNTVSDDGLTVEVNDTMQSFCCPSCLAAYEDRLETYRSRS